MGHPYLNPAEIWSILECAIDHSIYYADLNSHLEAVYGFIKLDYNFAKYWNQKPPEVMMNSFVKSNRVGSCNSKAMCK